MSDNNRGGAAQTAQKSHADIIAEMLNGQIPKHRHDKDMLRHYAHMLDTAYKREMKEVEVNAAPLPCVVIKHGMEKVEVNNNAELRDMLSKAIKRLEHVTGCDMHFFHPDATSCDGKTSMGECNHKRTCELIFESRKALAKPQRNCDIGTETEQQDRFDAFCLHPEDCRDCKNCNANRMGFVDCRIVWANMPYQENTK